MKKKISFLLIVALLSLSFGNPSICEAGSAKPKVSARSAILYDPLNGKVLYSKNIYTKRPVASITKIMTAMVVLDNLDLNKKVRVSSRASKTQPSKVYLVSGEYYTVRDLLYAVLLNSGNDAAVCLAEAVAGSEWGFVEKMNSKAWSIGLRNTKYINSSGLPGKGQYSTAYDQARVMRYAMKYSFLRKAMAKKTYTIRRPNGKKIRLRNHNKLLWRYSKKVLGKTGFTRAAGRTFLGQATYGNRKVIVCVLNTPKKWTDTQNLLDYALGRDNKQIIALNKKMHGKSGTKSIQRALRRAGCDPGKVDGVFGNKTLTAVFRFQRTAGIKVDGIVGQQTMSKLRQFM